MEKVNTQKAPNIRTVRDWLNVFDVWGVDFIRVLDGDVEYFAWEKDEATVYFQPVLDREVKESSRVFIDFPAYAGWKLEI